MPVSLNFREKEKFLYNVLYCGRLNNKLAKQDDVAQGSHSELDLPVVRLKNILKFRPYLREIL